MRFIWVCPFAACPKRQVEIDQKLNPSDPGPHCHPVKSVKDEIEVFGRAVPSPIPAPWPIGSTGTACPTGPDPAAGARPVTAVSAGRPGEPATRPGARIGFPAVTAVKK